MESIGERVRKVRLDKDLTQEMFADMLDVKRAIISANEIGSKPISQRTIKAICREFGVNETWLLTGEGEMYVKQEEDIVYELATKYGMTRSQAIFFKLLLNSSQQEVDAIISASKKIAEEFKNPLE